MADIEIVSPDKSRSIELVYLSELHFGPMVFRARPKGFEMPQGLNEVLECVCWSPNSKYVALCQVDYISVSRDFEFKVTVVDTENSTVKVIRKATSPVKIKSIDDGCNIST